MAAVVAVAVIGTTTAGVAQAEGQWNLFSLNTQAADTPSVVNYAGSTYIAIRAANGRIYWTDNTFAAQYNELPGGWTTPFAPTVVVYQQAVWLFIRGGGNDRRIWFRSLISASTNRWSGWSSVPGAASIGTPSVVARGSSLSVYYTDPQHHIRFSTYDGTQTIGGRWRPQNQMVPGAATNSSPTAVAYGLTSMTAIFHRGTDNRIYRRNYNAATDTFSSNWVRVGDLTTGTRIAAAVGGPLRDQIELAAQNLNSTETWAGTYDNDRFSDWHAVIGADFAANFAPALYTFYLFNQVRAYLVISDRRVHDLFQKQMI